MTKCWKNNYNKQIQFCALLVVTGSWRLNHPCGEKKIQWQHCEIVYPFMLVTSERDT